MYNLVEDADEDGNVLSIRALFDTAYVAGMSTDRDTLSIQSFYKKGTWIVDLGVQAGLNQLLISSSRQDEFFNTSPSSIVHGSITLNNNEIRSVGKYTGQGDFTVDIHNSASFTRVLVRFGDILRLSADIVAPPKAWMIPEQDTDAYTHVNMQVESISLSDAVGVLGETARVRYDKNGQAILSATGPNGEGLLEHPVEYYIVDSLFPSTSDAKYMA